MKNKSYIFIITLIIFMLFRNTIGQGKTIEPINDIIDLANGSIEEVGVRLNFKIEGYGEDELEKILNKLNIKDKYGLERSTDHGSKSLNFKGKDISGTIVSIKKPNNNSIVLDIIEKTTHNNVEELKNNLLKSLGLSNSNVQYFYYIKAKVPSDDTVKINDKIIRFLSSNGSINLKSIDIYNGYSTAAYTRKLEPINSNGKPIDLNYAVVNYASGTYIILGTPIIMLPY